MLPFSIKQKYLMSKYRFKMFCEKLKYGFNRNEVEVFDYTTAKFVLPRLVTLKKIRRMHPSFLEQEDWAEYLDKMILAFETIIKDYNWELDYKDRIKNYEIMQEGFLLFGEYYRYLSLNNYWEP